MISSVDAPSTCDLLLFGDESKSCDFNRYVLQVSKNLLSEVKDSFDVALKKQQDIIIMITMK